MKCPVCGTDTGENYDCPRCNLVREDIAKMIVYAVVPCDCGGFTDKRETHSQKCRQHQVRIAHDILRGIQFHEEESSSASTRTNQEREES